MADGSPQKYNPGRPVDLFHDDYPRRVIETQSESTEEDRQKPHYDENPSPVDEEIAAIKKIVDALNGLTPREQERVLKWAVSRFVR